VAKNVFRADEILYQSRKVFIEPPKVASAAAAGAAATEEPEALTPAAEEYAGPSVEDVRKEADAF
jgi:hypothetical protein